VNGTMANGLGSLGKTGVALHYHKCSEFLKLSEEQKKELKDWKSNNKKDGKRKGAPATKKKANKKMKGMIADFSATNKEAMLALVDSNSATVAAVADGLGSAQGTATAGLRGTIGLVTTNGPTKNTTELMLAPEVAALKLQGILKNGSMPDKSKSD
jgi:hypothetical protein